MADIASILALARTKKAADVHIVAGSPVLFRVAGDLMPVTRELLDSRMAKDLTYSMLSDEHREAFERDLDFDFMMSDAQHERYRVNVSYNDGEIGAVIRLLASKPMTLDEIRVPRSRNQDGRRPKRTHPHHRRH